MTGSLYWAMGVMLLTGGVLLVVLAWSLKRFRWWVAGVVGVMGVAVLLVHALLLNDDLAWARVMPWREIGVWSNPSAIGTGILGGVVWAKGKGPVWWRALVVLLLAGLGTWRTIEPAMIGRPWGPKPPPLGVDKWVRVGGMDVCRQTSQASCSAAAAATLLRSYGIEATEAEMVELCLTTEKGTRMLGLYRGLQIKTQGTPYRVAVFKGTLEEFRDKATGLAVVSVGLRQDANVDPRYETDWGWIRGVKHSVVASGIVDRGRVEVADPAVGRERWTEEGMRTLWFGEALYLVRR